MVLDQNKLYYERMASSVGDKARLLPFVTGSRILEIGFGGGELLDILSDDGYDVYGLDASPISEAKVLHKAYGVHTAEAYADEIGEHWGNKFFDSVILSSVMHEVFSYGNRNGKHKHSVQAVIDTLDSIRNSLVPGGRLVLRDGVLATNWSDKVYMKMLNDDIAGVEAYLRLQPFKDRVSLTRVDEDTYFGTLESVEAFAYTYTWGEAALPRESQELFGLFTLNGYQDILWENGFKVVHAEEYVQQGYIDALSPKIELTDESGEPVSFPPTNAIWVAERIS